MIKDPHNWIRRLGLESHPEGGWYASSWKSEFVLSEGALPDGFQGSRRLSSAIQYLLLEDEFSALHRLRSEEMWHFYSGGPIALFIIEPGGKLSERRLGPNPDEGQVFQAMVRAGCWFGARPLPGTSWALLGCTVSPGFEYEDFEIGERQKLLAEYPEHRELIESLTRV